MQLLDASPNPTGSRSREPYSPPRRRGVQPVDELVAQLQLRLSGAAGEKEAVRRALHKAKRIVDHYRKELTAATEHPQISSAADFTHRVQEMAQAMAGEMRELLRSDWAACSPVPAYDKLRKEPGSPLRSYDVLRQSLSETQRRCESLNKQMVDQSDANEELVQTLGTVKDANKRLLEQIRTQTDEITRLTQQRVADEEKMDALAKKHRIERDALERGTKQRLQATQEATDAKHIPTNQGLGDRLRRSRARLDVLRQDVTRLRSEVQAVDVRSFGEEVQRKMQGLERELINRLADSAKRQAARRGEIEAEIADLGKELEAEVAERRSEAARCSERVACLSASKEDLQASFTREQAQLASQLQSEERALEVERKVAADGRATLEAECSDCQRRRDEAEAALDKLKREAIRLESATSANTSEARVKEQAIADLRRQIRESADALAAAVSGNDHLQAQMEEQRQRFEEMNDADIAVCQSNCDQTLNEVRTAEEADLHAAKEQLAQVEEEVRARTEEAHTLREQADAVECECVSLRRDIDSFKSRTQSADVERSTLETELASARRSFAAEKLQLQTIVDTLLAQCTSLESEIRSSNEQFTDLKRVAMAQEAEQTGRIGSLEALLRDLGEEESRHRSSHAEITDALARVGDDLSEHRQQALSTQARLAEELDLRKKELANEQRRLEEVLSAEQQKAREGRENAQKWRDSHSSTLRQVQDEHNLKLSDLEREKARVEEKHAAEAAHAAKVSDTQKSQADSLEGDLKRVQHLLAESASNMQWVRREREREESQRQLQREQLEEEVRQANEAFAAVGSNEAALTEQYERALRQRSDDGGRLKREIGDLRQSRERAKSETDMRLEKEKKESEVHMQALEGRYRAQIEKDRDRVDSLGFENERLRHFIGETRSASAKMHAGHATIEGHLQRLQHHNDEFRHDLRSAPVAPPGQAARDAGG